MNTAKSICVVGGGSWATALVKILTENKIAVKWWLRSQYAVEHLRSKHHNPYYLSAVSFDPQLIIPENDLAKVIEESEIVILAVPSAFLKDVLNNFAPENFQSRIMVSAIKGMIPHDNLIIAEFLKEYYDVPFENTVIISGPCHSEEVALEKLSYLTLACNEQKHALMMCEMLQCEYIRCSPSDDIYGTEYSAVLKNIYALAAGICHGLGYGDNFQAVLISNAIEEIERFVRSVHPITRDIKDSAYLGDLLVTAYSPFSRNRALGTMIGKGYTMKAALQEMSMIAEGYNAAKCIHEVNTQYKVDLPICESTYRILYEGIRAREEMRMLSLRLN